MLKTVLIILGIIVFIVLAWLAIFGLLLVNIVSDTLGCALTLGLACNGEKKDTKNDQKPTNG